MGPLSKKMAFAIMGIGLALQAIFYLWSILMSLENTHVIFFYDAVLSFCYVLGISLFALGIALIIIWRFDGWNGWPLILRSMALVSLIVSLLVMVTAYYAVILMMPHELWGTYQGWKSGTLILYGAIVTWLSLSTSFFAVYALVFKTQHG
ncbi:MAG: hypothetical protein LUQ39_01415 [Methanomassiliicoccales archaeon]|nr:hypothetical protein [Methanomassiliicoccales archaeon]